MIREWWSADLLDNKDQILDSEMPGISGGKLEQSAFTPTGGTGSIEWTRRTTTPDWLSNRIRLWYHREGQEPIPQGVWIPTVPSYDYENGRQSASIKLSDKLEILQAEIGSYYTLPVGVNVINRVRTILSNRNVGTNIVPASTATARVATTWEPTKTWLTVLNDMLSMVNYASLYSDNLGVVRSEPYVAPENRPVIETFGAGDAQLVKSRFKDQVPIFDVPNVFIAIAKGTNDTPGLVAVARNTDPRNAFSIPRRGFEITKSEQVEATSLSVLRSIAARRLAESSQLTRRVDFTHSMVRNVWLNSVVAFEPLDLTGPIVQRSVTMTKGANVESTIRKIYTGGENPWG